VSRIAVPGLFTAWGGFVNAGGRSIALRWMTHPSLGLPREAFRVWRWGGGRLEGRPLDPTIRRVNDFESVLTWPGLPMAAAVQVTVTLAAGGSVSARAHSGPDAGGHVVDEETVVGPASARSIVLVGTPIASLSLLGEFTFDSMQILELQALIDSPDWVLIDRVGLPVDERFAFDYALDPQGPPGIDRTPVDAATVRVAEGTPSTFWPATTDTGRPTPAFAPPDPMALVTGELKTLLDAVLQMVTVEPERSRQADVFVDMTMPAPVSVHGVAAPPRWQDESRGGIRPLGSLLLAAGVDPYAALALGYGTTFAQASLHATPNVAAATNEGGLQLFLVTLAHKVQLDGLFPGLTFTLDGELAALVARVDNTVPIEPTGVRADPPPNDRIRLDRPAHLDAPWLEIVDVSWNAPPRPTAADVTPTGYSVLEAIGTEQLRLVIDQRPAGGHRPHAAAAGLGSRIHFTRSGLPEQFPGESADVVYAVAAHDWFGRWGPWRSTGHSRTVVPPQVPAVRRVVPAVGGGGAGPSGSAAIEFTWDWSNRTPQQVHLRLRLHEADDPPPAVDGSVLAVGAGPVPDLVIGFTSATPDTPPPGVEEIVEERAGALRTYRAVVSGLTFDYPTHPRIGLTAQARAAERVRPGVLGAFSGPATATAVSPIPPPPPFVPAAMQWASLPDPAGVARAVLRWGGAAATWSVYVADETALARELALPSPALDTPAAQRLVALRAADMGGARRAFRRIAENLTAPELPVELPRGSRLIHLYGVTATSATGVERSLPTGGNDYLAVATPQLIVPEAPILRVRPSALGIRLEVRVRDEPAAVGRVEITRVGSRHLAGTLEAAADPLVVLDSTSATRDGTTLVWEVDDPSPPQPWVPHFYRAVAWGAEEAVNGVFGGRSAPSAAVEAVAASPDPPDLSDLRVDPAGAPGDFVVSFRADVPPFRTTYGSHELTVTVVAIDPAPQTPPTVTTRRVGADVIELVTGPLPDAADAPAMFLHRPDATTPPRVTALVAGDLASVTAQVTDPAGRLSRSTRSVP
jgi:hypothetical protein